MHLSGQTKPETYGRISSWKEDPESSYKWVTGVGAQPGDGLVILEVQRRILRFLLECTHLVLHDLLPNVRTFGVSTHCLLVNWSHNPSFASRYLIRQTEGTNGPTAYVKARSNGDDQLWWLLQQLVGDDTVKICGLPSLLDEIERIVASDSKQRERLSPRLTRMLSDLAILAKLQRQIALSSPGGRIASAVPRPDLSSRMIETMERMWSIWDTSRLEMRVGKFGLDLKSFFYLVAADC